MVSLALGSILMLGISKLYVDSKRSYFQDEQAARVQENARYAMRLISHEIKNSDYPVGAFVNTISTIGTVTNDCGGGWALDPSDPLEHVDNTTDVSGTYSCISADETLDGTDLLVVKRTADTPTVDNGAYTSGASIDSSTWYMQVENNGNKVTILQGSAVNTSEIVGTDTGVDLWEYYAAMFYVRPNSVDGDGVPTLCVRTLTPTGMTLAGGCHIEGVENLQFEFGLDADADGQPEQFVANPTAAQMDQVSVIRIYLLMRSIDPIPDHTDDKTYQLGSEAVAAKNDRYHRLVYASTVAVRNRITR